MAVNLPENNESMVSGLGYTNYPIPANDASALDGQSGNQGAITEQIAGIPPNPPSPLQATSLPTKKGNLDELAPTGAFLLTNLHQDGWLNQDAPNMSHDSDDISPKQTQVSTTDWNASQD